MPPATTLRPTPVTASAGGTPAFWRKRTFSAMPPTLAGVTRFTNELASGHLDGGHERDRLRHAADGADGRRHVRGRGHSGRAEQPVPVGRTEGVDAVVDAGELREEDVERARRRRHHDDGSGAHPHEAFERLGLVPRGGGDPLAQRPQRRLRHASAGGGRQRQRLQVGRGGVEVVGRQHPGGRRRRRVGADDGRQRAQQLGPVDRLGARFGRRGRRAEVDDDDRAGLVAADEEVPCPGGAVRQAGVVHRRQPAPGAVEELVASPRRPARTVRAQRARRPAADRRRRHRRARRTRREAR